MREKAFLRSAFLGGKNGLKTHIRNAKWSLVGHTARRISKVLV